MLKYREAREVCRVAKARVEDYGVSFGVLSYFVDKTGLAYARLAPK